ncbi:hypothetical protein RUM44_009943 [Polyplax serrata]|uniref:Major facilitator superfamily associated domain-containing protein n=1 Tax=Polyplax serrata TaxID=468196 RepID=A0ABR1AU53_POLSC
MGININKDLLPLKAHYFLFNAGVSPVQPFMPVIAKDLKFSSKAVGIINGILPFTGMIAKPLFGAIADHYRLHKFIFICFQVITIIGFFSISFLTKIEDDSGQVKLVCGAETNFDVCFKGTSKDCLIKDILNQSFSEKTVKCSLRCDLSSDLRTELCGHWKANPTICTEDISSNQSFPEYRYITNEDKQLSNLSESSSSPISGVKLEFIATIPLHHTVKVGNCLYFRVADAELNDETHHIPNCQKATHTYCKIKCSDPLLSELLGGVDKDNTGSDDFVHHSQFWLYLFLAILSWVGMAVVCSVADALCFELLGDNGSQYGKQRLWGSVGWGIFAIISGLLVDQFSTAESTNYAPAFYIMLIVISCDVFASYLLKYEQTKVSTNIFRNVGNLLKDVWINIFLVWCIIVGMCVGVQWTFLFWHLESLTESCDESSKKTILGLVSGVQCFLGELPSFFLFGWIIKKLGHVHLMTLIPFIIGIRFILYSLLPNPWWALPIEVLQSSLGLSFATMASYASIVAPPGAEATVQGLVGATFEGIGVSLGSYLGGIIFKERSGAGLFQIFGIVAFGLGILHGTLQYILRRNKRLDISSKGGFKGVAIYAIPNEAVSMLEDT